MSIPKGYRSGGPRTIEGKLIAARNSTTHGAYTELAILPSENLEEYQKLCDAIFLQFNPKDAISEYFVTQIVITLWKIQRLQKIENNFIDRVFSQKISEEEYSENIKFINSGLTSYVVSNLDQYTKFPIDRVLVSLKFATDLYNKTVALVPRHIDNLKENSPVLYEFIVQKNLEIGNTEINPKDLLRTNNSKKTKSPNTKEINFRNLLKEFIDFAKHSKLALENKQEILEGIQIIQEKRLVLLIDNSNLGRANKMLTNMLSKHLRGLRAHQKWMGSQLNLLKYNSDVDVQDNINLISKNEIINRIKR